jgi:arylsulfatase A-like enzyme
MTPRRESRFAGVAHGVTVGTVAALATALIDFLGTGAFAGWSPARLAALFGVQWGAAALLCVGAALFDALARRAVRGVAREGVARALGPLPHVLAAAYPALAFADRLFSGASASKLPLRPALVAVVALTLLAGLYAFVRLAPTIRELGRSARRALALALFGLALALTLVNRAALPNLYPAVHGLLSLVVLTGYALAAHALAPDAPRARPRATFATLLATSCLALAAALFAVERSPVLRVSLFDPRASVSQPLMRGLDPLTRALALRVAPRRAGRRARAAGPVHTANGPVLRDAHLLLVTVDALRADHLGLYGYHRPTSPELDALAREAVVFEHAYAQAPHSSYSLCSLMTSEYLHETIPLGLPLPEATLARTLHERGYHTAGIYTRGIFHTDGDRLAIYDERGFDLDRRNHRSMDADARTEVALEELDDVVAHGEPPSFLWVHYFDVHEPYRATTFGERDIDRYDSEIRRVDAAVARLLRGARARLTRDLVVVLTADHGEEFRDHGGLYHGSSVYEEQIRVPLLVFAPGIEARRIDTPVELVDVAPTLLLLTGAEVPSSMRGDDLRGLATGRGEAPRFAFSAVQSRRAVVEWPYKLIYDTSYRLVELFDLASDPRERRNLAARSPERVEALTSHLEAWVDGLSQPARKAPDPVRLALSQGRLRDPRAIEPLKALLADRSVALETRREAARLLGGLRDRSARDALLRALRSSEPAIADEAAIALAQLGDAHGKGRLARLIEGGSGAEEDAVRRAAVGLGQLGDRRAVPALIEALEGDADVRERRQVVWALGALGDPRAVDALIDVIPEFKLRAAAAIALGRIGDARGYEPIASALAVERNRTLRDSIARGLGQLGDPRALPILLAMTVDEPELVNPSRALIRLGALRDGIVGGVSLWGREQPRLVAACAPRAACGDDARALELTLRVPASLRGRPAQVILRARVGRGETSLVTIELGGRRLDPVELEAEPRERRVSVPADALRAAHATVRLVVRGATRLEVDHLLLVPIASAHGA